MRFISVEEGFYVLRIKKKKIKYVFLITVLISILVLVFLAFHSYRYERFKDGHKYMRYDKWLDRYEKYDIPTKEWNPI